MKAVILAAGKGVRMMPLTKDTPKPLLKIKDKALIDHTIDVLPTEVSEIIVVVNYLGEKIVEYLKQRYPRKIFKFVWQKKCNGTAKALELARPFLGKEKFLVIFADDLHSKSAVRKAAKHDLALLVAESKTPEKFGVVVLRKDAIKKDKAELEVENILEKPVKSPTNLVNVGVHVLDSRIFNYKTKKQLNGEYCLTDMLNGLAASCRLVAVKTDFWLPIGYPADLKNAELKIPR